MQADLQTDGTSKAIFAVLLFHRVRNGFDAGEIAFRRAEYDQGIERSLGLSAGREAGCKRIFTGYKGAHRLCPLANTF